MLQKIFFRKGTEYYEILYRHASISGDISRKPRVLVQRKRDHGNTFFARLAQIDLVKPAFR